MVDITPVKGYDRGSNPLGTAYFFINLRSLRNKGFITVRIRDMFNIC